MAELERDLRSLASEIEWPPTPAPALRLDERRSRPLWRRRALVALVAAVLAFAVALSVPAARSGLLRLFHLGGVTVEQIAVLPPAQERGLAEGLGPLVDRKAAETALGAPVRLPANDGVPRLHLRDGVVSVLLAAPQPVLFSQFRSDEFLLKKIATGSTSVVPITVGRAPGLWIAGAPHLLAVPPAPPRLAGNVLVWQRGQITYRLEGRDLTKAAALRLASEIEGT
jgi:hypothetical protein